MSEKIKTALAILIILIVLPYIITYAIQGNGLFLEPGSGQQNTFYDEPTEKFIGILANQISMEAPEEAIKAQAVLVRTEYYRRLENGEEPEQSLSADELAKLWGSDNLKKYYEIAEKAVFQTNGKILRFRDHLIQPAFHKVSAGFTRGMTDQSGNVIPYLCSVACEKDITSLDYLTVRFFSKEEFAKALGLDVSEDLIYDIRADADESGYVNQISINEKKFTGDEMRNMLELPSPCFYIKEVEGKMRIVVKGKGHGIGLSQYAAMKQAEDGMSYAEILAYFFPKTSLDDYESCFDKNLNSNSY